MLTIEEGAEFISKTIERCLATDTGCILGRNGSTELTTLFYMDMYRICNAQMAQNLERYSGIFPATVETVQTWADTYKKALASIENEPIVAGWFQATLEYEKALLLKACPKSKHMPLRCLEPYYVSPEKRWSRLLAGQKVAVVSSFAKTIEKQVARASDIWGADAESLLPSSTQWFPIQTGFPPVIAKGSVSWPENCVSWKEALEILEQQVISCGARICLIGCGALGIPLAARLKKHGIVCVVMGGAIQVLFGIKGKRWETHSVIGKFWNPSWTWPALDEIPGGAQTIEGGCYWQGAEKN